MMKPDHIGYVPSSSLPVLPVLLLLRAACACACGTNYQLSPFIKILPIAICQLTINSINAQNAHTTSHQLKQCQFEILANCQCQMMPQAVAVAVGGLVVVRRRRRRRRRRSAAGGRRPAAVRLGGRWTWHKRGAKPALPPATRIPTQMRATLHLIQGPDRRRSWHLSYCTVMLL
jgi:hypothetical protein